jgi:hypothetical protein
MDIEMQMKLIQAAVDMARPYYEQMSAHPMAAILAISKYFREAANLFCLTGESPNEYVSRIREHLEAEEMFDFMISGYGE